jgi:hypothetical protein
MRLLMIGGLMAMGFVAAGCQCEHARVYDWEAVRQESYTSHSPAVVMGADRGESLQASIVEGEATGVGGAAPGWWLNRNDARLSVRNGYRYPEVEGYVIYTYDRQQQYGGRVYDNYYRNTYSTRVGEVVR